MRPAAITLLLALPAVGCAPSNELLAEPTEDAMTLIAIYPGDITSVVQSLRSDGCLPRTAAGALEDARLRCSLSSESDAGSELVVTLSQLDGERVVARGSVWARTAGSWSPVALATPTGSRARVLLERTLLSERLVESARYGRYVVTR